MFWKRTTSRDDVSLWQACIGLPHDLLGGLGVFGCLGGLAVGSYGLFATPKRAVIKAIEARNCQEQR